MKVYLLIEDIDSCTKSQPTAIAVYADKNHAQEECNTANKKRDFIYSLEEFEVIEKPHWRQCSQQENCRCHACQLTKKEK